MFPICITVCRVSTCSPYSQYAIAAPDITVSHTAPASGPVTGNTLTDVFGSGFVNTGEIQVAFGDTYAMGTYMSATLMQALSPALPAGNQTVRVALNGQQFVNATAPFFYYGTILLLFVLSFVVSLTRSLLCSHACAALSVAPQWSAYRRHACHSGWHELHTHHTGSGAVHVCERHCADRAVVRQ